MADLDKKIQKSQPDLVESVMEALLKRNWDRVEILITNALKQLKGSRFKPDQSICIGLFYLARIQPKIFSCSPNLQEYLKNHIKRDGVPANIKENKTDFFLPVLAANILVASCDSPEIRAIILTRINQWISSNQKLNELVQHLLATLCVRCHDDPATIETLIEMRHQWFGFLESNFTTYGRASPNLTHSIRSLLGNANTCESLIENLTFLIKHDSDVLGLCSAMSRFIIQRPLTFNSFITKEDQTDKVVNLMLEIFEAYFKQHSCDVKNAIKFEKTRQSMVFNLSSSSQVIHLDEIVVRALLSLMSAHELDTVNELPQIDMFFKNWLTDARASSQSSKVTYVDSTLTTPYQFPTELLSKMIGKKSLHALAIYSATPLQLIELALNFGQGTSVLNEIFERLDVMTTNDFAGLDVRDSIYFNEMMDYYTEIGVNHAAKLRDRLNSIDLSEQECESVQQPIEVKIKKEII